MQFFPNCRVVLKAVFDGFGSDSDPVVIGADADAPLIPMLAHVHFNGYKDTGWNVDFDADRFPFQPGVLRNAALAIYMFHTNGVDDNPDNYLADDKSLMVAGLVDDVDLDLDSSGRKIHVSGRDYTALLIDRVWNPSKSGHNGRVPTGKDLVTTVQALANEAVVRIGSTASAFIAGAITGAIGQKSMGQGTQLLTVRYIGNDAIPIVGASMYKTKKRGLTVQAGRNYWDAIYDTCIKHGKICFVRGTDLIISDPNTLAFDPGSVLGGIVGFVVAAERAIGGALGFSVKKPTKFMIYGRNLEKLRITRHMGKDQVPQVVATSYDPRTRSPITARYPDHAELDKAKKTGLGTKKETIEYVVAPPGVIDLATLKDYARAYYVSKYLDETKFRWSTYDLVDVNKNDLLEARPGDPSHISFDLLHADLLVTMTAGQREAELIEQGFSKTIAKTIAEHTELLREYRKTLYMHEITFSWSVDSGIEIDASSVGYVSVKRDAPDAGSH